MQKTNDSIKKTELLKYIREYLINDYFDDHINGNTLENYLNISKIQREVKLKYDNQYTEATYTTYEKYVRHLIKQHTELKQNIKEIKGLDFETITSLIQSKDKIIAHYDELKQLLKPFKYAVELRDFLRKQLLGFVTNLIDPKTSKSDISIIMFSDFSYYIYLYFVHIKHYDESVLMKYYKMTNGYECIDKKLKK